MFATHYRCLLCGTVYEWGGVRYVCPHHGAVGTLDVCYDYESIQKTTSLETISNSQEWSMWRYLSLLPVSDVAFIPPLAVGWTPLYHVPRLGKTVNLSDLWIKDDGRNPTASFKDRASAMAVVQAQTLGADTVTTASTGNAAAALAGLAASVGIRAVIFVPKSAPEAKIAQLLVYGAEVFLVDGSYNDAFELCLMATQEQGWYCRNTGYNSFMTEGKKTVSYEIVEQLGWQVPDVVVVSVGDGSIMGGVHKGFYDLFQLGWIDKIPRLIGVQAEGSDACVRAWEASTGWGEVTLPHIAAATRADSISADFPRDGYKAVRAVQQSNGAFVRVSDAAILAAIPEVAQRSGVFVEPAAAAAWAGTKEAVRKGVIQTDERVVVIATGSGLKDIGAVSGMVRAPQIIDSEGVALRQLLAVS